MTLNQIARIAYTATKKFDPTLNTPEWKYASDDAKSDTLVNVAMLKAGRPANVHEVFRAIVLTLIQEEV